MTNRGRLVLRSCVGAISLCALETWPVENKKSFHLIRLFPLENFINYRRKLLYWNICSRWSRTSCYFLLSLFYFFVFTFFFPSDLCWSYLKYVSRLLLTYIYECIPLSDCLFVCSSAFHFSSQPCCRHLASSIAI